MIQIQHHSAPRIALASLVMVVTAVSVGTSCKLARGPLSSTASAGKSSGEPFVCTPVGDAHQCLKRSGDIAPCLDAVVIQPTDTPQALVYVVRGVTEDGTFQTRRPYLFEHAKTSVLANAIQVFWGPRLSPSYQSQMTATGTLAQGFNGTLSGVYKTQFGEEVYAFDMHCRRDGAYKQHLDKSPEWEDELSQQPF